MTLDDAMHLYWLHYMKRNDSNLTSMEILEWEVLFLQTMKKKGDKNKKNSKYIEKNEQN